MSFYISLNGLAIFWLRYLSGKILAGAILVRQVIIIGNNMSRGFIVSFWTENIITRPSNLRHALHKDGAYKT